MKLWQKIFLWTLLMVMVAVSTIEILLLKNNFKSTINEQTERLISEHIYMKSNINNKIIANRLMSDSILLTKAEVINTMRDIFEDSGTNSHTIVALFSEDNQIVFSSSSFIELNLNLLNTINEQIADDNISYSVNKPNSESADNILSATNQCYTQILNLDKSIRFYVASYVSFERQDFIFVTSTDISDIYQSYREQLKYAKVLCIALSLICAIILLILVKLLLRPLEYLNRTTHAIASGNYGQRINVHSHDELGMLANNMNIMANSVEENVSQLKEVAENRKNFIDNLSHEMKTPLTSILGFADIMRIKRNISSDELHDYSNIIFDEATRLKNLSGKLMELITIGETNLELAWTDTEELFSQIENVMQPIFMSNDMTFDVTCHSCMINVDLELFKSMLFNFIDNAIKASSKNSVIQMTGVFEKPAKTQNHTGMFIISIIDNGIGISREELGKITEPFYMVDKARSRKAGGAGLGLALCKQVAEIHSADFKIFSEPQKGTTIKIFLKGVERNEDMAVHQEDA